ncbi:MAG: Crp/Fnr family transcriptional regulator [Rhodocyclaceae bacterium]|nr:Crp/Fnr family transcriptional regulator [Rhodocyclaceae bacterium]
MKTRQIDLKLLLPRIGMFSQLDARQIERLSHQCRYRLIDKGEVLFQRGDPAHGFYHVVAGQVKLALSSRDGSEKVVEIIGPGHSFGEAVMFLDRPYPVFAQALVASELLQVDQGAVFGLLEEDPAFARAMLAGMAIRLHTMVLDVESYSTRTATQRVAAYLLEETDAAGAGASLRLPASKQVIASRLNLTPETFSRTLHLLVERELISMNGRDITILDREGLAAS